MNNKTIIEFGFRIMYSSYDTHRHSLVVDWLTCSRNTSLDKLIEKWKIYVSQF